MEDKERGSLKKLIKDTALESMREFKDTRVPVYFIANRLQEDENLIRNLFKEMVSNDEFPGEYDSEGDYIVYKKPPPKCYGCGAPMDERVNKCEKCGLELRMCMLCKKFIREIPAVCPHCKSAAHEEHIKQWLKGNIDKKTGKGPCPKCGKAIDPSELMDEDSLYKSYFTF